MYMKKIHIIYYYLLFFFGNTISVFAQKDSLNINDSYWEDQLYINITYNIFRNQPEEVNPSKVSYGVGIGYIKDIPLNKRNTFALGLGLGYNYDLYTHGIVVEGDDFSVSENIPTNKINLHNLEIPIQIRWRKSDAITYSFWRVYFGPKITYNFSNKFRYTIGEEDFEFKNINNYNKLQTGLELSFGYGPFNFYTYYGLSPFYDNAILNNQTIDTKVLKLGLIFYLL